MFIPTNSDEQVSVNLRKKENEKKILKKFYLPISFGLLSFALISTFFFFFLSGTHMSLYSISWSVSAPKQFILSRFQFYLS